MFKVDDTVVVTVTAQEVFEHAGNGTMIHFDKVFNTGAAGTHTLELIDQSNPSDVGFALDNVQVHDWFVA